MKNFTLFTTSTPTSVGFFVIGRMGRFGYVKSLPR